MAAVDVSGVSGFPEWLPATRRAELHMLDVIRDKFELYGFASIETPAVERLEVLTAKGGVGRQIFGVTRPTVETEKDGTGLGLHFDLTVPLARYVAKHQNDLTFPFRRYQIQKVWRGERAQRGRFREFYQCDIDVVGRGGLDVLYDAEIPCVINEIFSSLHIGEFRIHISNRRVLSALFESVGVAEKEDAMLRIVDRFHKVDSEELKRAMVSEGLAPEQAARLLSLIESTDLGALRGVLSRAGASLVGIDELEAVYAGAIRLGIPSTTLVVDLSIARGLDYYTGTVFETFVAGRETWGSVCSGGRYDNLAGHFHEGMSFPGVGISIGLSRLVALLEAESALPTLSSTPSVVLVTTLDRDTLLDNSLELAARLRAERVASEVFLGEARLSDQLKYASNLGIRFVVIQGRREAEAGTATLRDLASGVQVEVESDGVVQHLLSML